MVNFRSCPRCGGDMKTTRDMYGSYMECLQCGHMVDIPQQPKERTRLFEPERRKGKKRKAA